MTILYDPGERLVTEEELTTALGDYATKSAVSAGRPRGRARHRRG